MDKIAARLEYLRGEIDAERISYGEIAELQGLVEHIAPGDVQLLEWAGVPEFPDDEDEDEDDCQGHSDGPVMGETFYCDGTCRIA